MKFFSNEGGVFMRRVIVLTALIIFTVFCRPGFCQKIENRWALGLDASYILPEDAEYKDTFNGLSRINLSYGINNNLVGELEAGSFRLKSKWDSKTRIYTLFTNLELRATSDKIIPYVVVGMGLAFFSYDDLHSTEKKDKVVAFAYKAGVGAEYFLTKNWAVNLEAVHFYTDPGEKTNLDVYSWQYSGGIKYYF